MRQALTAILLAGFLTAQAAVNSIDIANNTVEIVYNGTTATVNVATNISKYVTVSSGTKILDGAGYTNATITGGSNVSLSSYTGGGGGPGGGGRPW